MSRTIRRKNEARTCNRLFIYTKEEFDQGFGWWKTYCNHYDYEKYVERTKAWFHSDQARYLHLFRGRDSGGTPRKYRMVYAERPFRREVKQKIHKANRYDTWDEMGFRAPRFDAWICD